MRLISNSNPPLPLPLHTRKVLQKWNGGYLKIWLHFLSHCVKLLNWSFIIRNKSNCKPPSNGAVINRKCRQQNANGCAQRAPHKLASPFLKLYHYYILKMLICWADFPGERSKLVPFPNCLSALARLDSTSDLLITIRLLIWAPSSIDNFRHIKHVLAKVISQF